MNKFIVNRKALMKNVLIEDGRIRASLDNYKTRERFEEKMAQKTKMQDSHIDIQMSQITKFIPYTEYAGVVIFWDKQKTFLQFTYSTVFTEFIEELKLRTGFLPQEKRQGRLRSWIRPALYALLSLFLTFATYMMALDLESGKEVTVSGSRRGAKLILLWLAETLGSSSALILGLLVASWFVYRSYKSIREGLAMVQVYEKQ